MKKLKTEEGITLISLSVTIVVLIILAGITVSYVIGDNGLIAQAKGIEANIIVAEKEAQEQINALKGEEKYTEDGTVILGDVNSPTVNSLTITEFAFNSFRVNIDVTETGSGIDKIEYSADDGVTYVMPVESKTAKTYKFENLQYSEQYNVKVKVTDKNGNQTIISKLVDNIKIGDYVDYTYDTVSSGYSLLAQYSGYDSDQTIAQSSTTLQWIVLNIDDTTGKIDLVSENPTDNTVYFKGALGYNNGVYLLNDICKNLYSNSTIGAVARSMNLADTEKHLTTTGFAARNAYTGDVQYGTTKLYKGSYSYYPNLYANQLGAGINLAEEETIVQPNINGTIDPYNESDSYYSTPTNETYTPNYGTVTDDNRLIVTQTHYNIAINETNYGEAVSILRRSDSFWLASRYANTNSGSGNSIVSFGLRNVGERMYGNSLFRSSSGDNVNYNYLRPVVSLSYSLLDGTRNADGVWQLK